MPETVFSQSSPTNPAIFTAKVRAAGGSKSYSELLAPFGLDAKDPGFWTIGLSVIERMIGELETMG